MERIRRFPDLGRHGVALATTILLAAEAGMVLVFRRSGGSAAGELAAAALCAAAIAAIAALGEERAPYPRWAFRGAAALFAGAVLVPSLPGVGHGSWSFAERGDLWMLPWNLLVLSTLPASRCADRSRRSGWFLFGASLLLVILLEMDFWLPLIARAAGPRGAI